MARKQGLMTNDQFQAILIVVNMREDDTFRLAEDLDFASQAVGGGEEAGMVNDSEGIAHQPVDEVEEKQTGEGEPKSVTPQPEAGESDTRIDEKETEVQPEETKPVVPPVSKPMAVKRKLVLKNDPKAERPQPKRISQRCLGRWTSSKAGANTAADAVQISSEEERSTPTKPGEEPLSATNLEDTSTATEMVSATPSDLKEATDEMAEGLDLASESIGHEEPGDDNINTCVETEPTTQQEPSTPAEKKPDEDENEEEEKYLQERKRKGKALITKKSSSKKQRTGTTRIEIREPGQRIPPHRREADDSEYTTSEESESESDVSLEDEEHSAQQLPDDHRELIHPPVERLKYKR